MKQDMFVKH